LAADPGSYEGCPRTDPLGQIWRRVVMKPLAGACAVGLILGLLAIGAQATTAAATTEGTLRVAFLRGEQLAQVSRRGTSPHDAVRALIAGPTAAEHSRGFRTYFRPSTRLRRLSLSGSLATVDFNRVFVSGSDERTAARVAQLVRTLTGLRGI